VTTYNSYSSFYQQFNELQSWFLSNQKLKNKSGLEFLNFILRKKNKGIREYCGSLKVAVRSGFSD